MWKAGADPALRAEVFRSRFFTTVEEHSAMLEELIRQLEADAEPARGDIPVVTAGILADASELAALLQETGLSVAGDTMASQSGPYLCPEASEEGDPMKALAGWFASQDSSLLFDSSCFGGGKAPGSGQKEHIRRTVELAKSRHAGGVIHFLTKFCDPEEFDAVLLKRLCQEEGIPCLILEVDRQNPVTSQMRTRLQAFRELMEE